MSVSARQSRSIYRAVLLAAGLLVGGLLFQQLLTLLVAVLITVLVAIPLSAAATKLQRRGVPRIVGAPATLLLALAACGGLLALLIPSFVDQVNTFVDQSPHIVESLERHVHDVTGVEPRDVGDRVQHSLRKYGDDPGRLIGPLASIGLTVLSAVAGLLVVLLAALFIAIRPRPLLDGVLRIFPPRHRTHAAAVMRRVRDAWIGWMLGLAVAMFTLGLIFYAGLLIVGLDFALVFAVISALAVVVPYFGALASGIPPVLYALTYSPGKALAVMAVCVVAHQVEGNIIAPLVMARAIRLHPALIAVGVVVIGKLIGPIGLVVAVPILAATVVLTDELWVKPLERRHQMEAMG